MRQTVSATPGSALPWYGQWARLRPDRPALVGPEGSLTYAELLRSVDSSMRALAAQGVQPGDRLELTEPPDSHAWVVQLLAGLDLGLQLVIPDQDWTAEARPNHVHPLLRRGQRSSATEADGAGLWLFTSGTTERPKPRFRALAAIRHEVDRLRRRLPDKWQNDTPTGLCLLPLSHGFGLINGLLLVHALGGTVLRGQIDHPDRIARLLREHPVEILYSWPAQLQQLTDPALWHDAATPLRWCVCSSQRLAPDIAHQFSSATGCAVRQQYGATETGPLALDSATPPSASTQCMGMPLAGVNIRILDDQGQVDDGRRHGELAVKVPHMHLPVSELTTEGFWPTGDEGHLDGDGRVHVVRRRARFTDERG